MRHAQALPDEVGGPFLTNIHKDLSEMSKTSNRQEARTTRPADYRFGRAVIRERKRFGYTQPDLAHITGVQNAGIKSIENSRNNILSQPFMQSIAKIANDLDIPLTDIILGTYHAPRTHTRRNDRYSISKIFGKRLHAARETNGLTRSQLSSETAREHLDHLSVAALASIEKGDRAVTIDEAVTLASTLDRSIEDFIPRQRITYLDDETSDDDVITEYLTSLKPNIEEPMTLVSSPIRTDDQTHDIDIPASRSVPELSIEKQLAYHRRALEGEELDVKQRQTIIARLERQLDQS